MKTQTPSLLILALVAVVAAGCGSPEPCTDCPSVGGLHDLIVYDSSVLQSDCGNLLFLPTVARITVVQNGSELVLDGLMPEPRGTLFEDWTFELGPYASTTTTGEPGQTTWTGEFAEDGDRYKAEFTIRFDLDYPKCKVITPGVLLPLY